MNHEIRWNQEFPAAYRAWIERVYQLEPWADEPTTITEKFNRFLADEFGRYYVARQLSKSEATPWPDTEGAAARLTRDGDMNLSLLWQTQGRRYLPDDAACRAKWLLGVRAAG